MPNSVTDIPEGQFIAIPHAVMISDDYFNLSGAPVKLLNALIFQYDGRNNGDLQATFSLMHKQHGFRSQDSLRRAIKELLTAKIITQTRERRGGRCALFAISWLPITPPKKPSLAQILGQADSPSHQNPVRRKVSLDELFEAIK